MKNADPDERAAEPSRGSERAQATAPDSGAPLLTHPAFLRRLRCTVNETYVSMTEKQQEAVGAIEAVIAALARPEVNLDPQRRSELIAKFGGLLGKLDRLQAMLPQGKEAALKSLDGMTALLQQLDEEQTKGRSRREDP